MNVLKNKKGSIRVIEAFFASVMLLACMMLIPTQLGAEDSDTSLGSKAQNILLNLDEDGYLAKLIDESDWVSLSDCIESALPLTVWFNLTVFDKNSNALNNYPICNGGAVSNKIASIEYICASPSSSFEVYVLQLQLAAVD